MAIVILLSSVPHGVYIDEIHDEDLEGHWIEEEVYESQSDFSDIEKIIEGGALAYC